MFASLGKTLTNTNTLIGAGIGAISVLGLLGGAKFFKKRRHCRQGKSNNACQKAKRCHGGSNTEPTVLTVAVTGAAGQIGYAFLPLLLTGQCFGPHTKINLRLLDVPQAEEILKGVILEIEDGAYPLLNSVASGSDPKEMFKDADVVVFVGGFPRKQGMERKDLLKINGDIFRVQGAALNEVAKKTCKSLVVANPANTNCLILAEAAPSIPKENFTALTRLDQNRGLSQIALKAGKPITDVKDVIIWGNHSVTQYPDVNHGTITVDGKKKTIREVIADDDYLFAGDFIGRVQKRGGEVLAARKNSSVMSAANAVKDHLRDWYFGSSDRIVSMGVYTQPEGPYGITSGLVFSLPVKTSNFGYEIVEGLTIDSASQELINITTEELVSERTDAFSSSSE